MNSALQRAGTIAQVRHFAPIWRCALAGAEKTLNPERSKSRGLRTTTQDVRRCVCRIARRLAHYYAAPHRNQKNTLRISGANRPE
jgi:hypothetical protein